MPNTSRYVVVVDNLSSTTRSADLEYEFKYAGKIRDIIRDAKARCALVEYERADDADYAYRKLHGIYLNGRQIRVERATKSDFKFFGWKWSEYTPSPSPRREHSASRSRSRSRSRSASRSRSRSPGTPHDKPEAARGAVSDAPHNASKAKSGSESPHN